MRPPVRDDILIHDYQIANSVTINSILSNYIVDLNYAVDAFLNPAGGPPDSYFMLVGSLEESDVRRLDDDVNVILDVSDGNGTFK